MKIRSAAALLLVFALAFSLCACRKLEKGESYEVVSDVYYVDDIGLTHSVQTQVNDEGETEYYYTDSDGNVVTVASDDVTIETRRVVVTTGATANGTTAADGSTEEQTTLTPAQQEFIDSLTDPEKSEDIYEENDASLEISDDVIDTDNMKTVTVETNSDGNPVHSTSQDFFNELTESKKYTIKMTLKSSSDGEVTTIDVTMMQDGDNLYIETKLPVSDGTALPCCILVKDGKCIMYMPTIKAYMEVPSDTIAELKKQMELATEEDSSAEYDTSGKVTVGGVTYDVDIYQDGDNTIKYYYLDGQIKRVESIEPDGDVSIIEYNSISDTVDSSKFKVPTGYFNMTDLMNNEDLLEAIS